MSVSVVIFFFWISSFFIYYRFQFISSFGLNWLTLFANYNFLIGSDISITAFPSTTFVHSYEGLSINIQNFFWREYLETVVGGTWMKKLHIAFIFTKVSSNFLLFNLFGFSKISSRRIYVDNSTRSILSLLLVLKFPDQNYLFHQKQEKISK